MSYHSFLLEAPDSDFAPHPLLSPEILLKQAIHWGSDIMSVLDRVPIITTWAFLLRVNTCPTTSLFWLYQLPWAECRYSVDDAVCTDSLHTWSQLASQKSSHHPGPDCASSTTSFSRGLVGRFQKTLLKIWLWFHSDSFCNFFSGTLLWESPCKQIILIDLKIHLFFDEDEVSWFCQATFPFRTCLISMEEFKFEGQFNTLSILRHLAIIVQPACIIFKIVNKMLIWI